jgi:hypothetical protein
MARLRSRNLIIPAGRAKWHGTGGLGDVLSQYNVSETCSDVVGYPDQCNPFALERLTNVLWFASGRSGADPLNSWHYENFASQLNISAHVGPSTPEPSNAACIDIGASRTNINRPITDLPVAVFEMKDIPRLVKSAGDKIRFAKNLSRGQKKAIHELPYLAASSYLEHEFAYRPLIRDFLNMIGFVSNVGKKLDILNQLYEGGGHGKSFSSTVWRDTAVGGTGANYLTGLYQESNYFATRKVTERKKWVSIKWKPTGPPPKTDDEKMALAIRLAYGLELSFATLWEAMPWSWLVDWFTTVGDRLTSTRNIIPVNASNSCVMLKTHTRWEATYRISGDGGNPTSNGAGRLNLSRSVGGSLGTSVLRSIPFLDGKQLSLLAAIGVTRR